MVIMDYLKFGRSLADEENNLLFFQIVDKCIHHFELDAAKSDFLFDLANAAMVKNSYLISCSLLNHHGVIPKLPCDKCIDYLLSIGLDNKDMILNKNKHSPNILLSWEGVLKCFSSCDEKTKQLCGHALFIAAAYDAYEQQLIVKLAISKILKLENIISNIETTDFNAQMIHPVSHTML